MSNITCMFCGKNIDINEYILYSNILGFTTCKTCNEKGLPTQICGRPFKLHWDGNCRPEGSFFCHLAKSVGNAKEDQDAFCKICWGSNLLSVFTTYYNCLYWFNNEELHVRDFGQYWEPFGDERCAQYMGELIAVLIQDFPYNKINKPRPYYTYRLCSFCKQKYKETHIDSFSTDSFCSGKRGCGTGAYYSKMRRLAETTGKTVAEACALNAITANINTLTKEIQK